MNISSNAVNVLSILSYRGIGKAWIAKYYERDQSPKDISRLINTTSRQPSAVTSDDFMRARDRIYESLESLSQGAYGAVAKGDPNFPVHRGQVNDSEKPAVLFYRGNIALLERANRNVAVIGLLNPDPSTEGAERRVVARLVNGGATIVSGLALGCDCVAHTQALDSNGTTVAILPSSLMDVTPSANLELAERIVAQRGLLVSEYFEKATSKRELISRYQERDRLQALFSECVVLAASFAKNEIGNDSGARLAMQFASKYGIRRAVIYDERENGSNPKYDLSRQMLAEDDGVIVINARNLEDGVAAVLASRVSQASQVTSQSELFG